MDERRIRVLLLHNSVLKTRGKLRTKLFCHGKRQRLWHENGSDSFPRFRDGPNRYRKEPFGRLPLFGSDQDHSAATRVTIMSEIDSQTGRSSQG